MTLTPSRGVLAIATGAACAVATFWGGLYPANVTLGIIALILWRRPPLWAYPLAAPIAVSAFWSPEPVYAIKIATAIMLLATVLPVLKDHFDGVAWGFGLTLLLEIPLLAFLMVDHPRLAGLHANASVLGQVGVTLLVLLPLMRSRLGQWGGIAMTAIAFIAASSRAAIAAGIGFGALNQNRRVLDAIAIVIVLGILHMGMTNSTGRVSFATLGASLEERRELLVSADEQGRTSRLSPIGYGYGGYNTTTGRQNPHVLPVLAAYELGVLLIPVAGVLVWALWTRRLPLATMLPLAVLWAFTEEQWSTGAGIYMLALIVAVGATRRSPDAAMLARA